MISFNNLSTLTLTSLILAITFTVLAVAGIFFSIYKKGNIKNGLAKICCLMILPYIALAMWTLAGLSIAKAFANNEALAIIIALVVGGAAMTILYFVSKGIETLLEKKDNLDKDATRDELIEELCKVEEDLSNLKGIINDVIDEPEKEEVEPEKIVVVKVVEKAEETAPVEEVKEETIKQKTIEELIEEVKEELKEIKEEVKEDSTEVAEEPVAEIVEDAIVEEAAIEGVIEEPVVEETVVEEIIAEEVVESATEEAEEPVVEETVEAVENKETTEITEEEVDEIIENSNNEDMQRESDFIRSLNEILEELENSSIDE